MLFRSEGGYILVGPMGYNPQGWYGSPVIVMNGPPGQGKGKAKGGPPPTPEPPNLAELSEKDVMNVLALMRKEFSVDDKRTYLMGHSMGGANAICYAAEHPEMVTALVVIETAPEVLRSGIETIRRLLATGSSFNSLEDAIEAFQQVVNINLNSFMAYYYLGLSLSADRRYGEAIEPLKMQQIADRIGMQYIHQARGKMWQGVGKPPILPMDAARG